MAVRSGAPAATATAGRAALRGRFLLDGGEREDFRRRRRRALSEAPRAVVVDGSPAGAVRLAPCLVGGKLR